MATIGDIVVNLNLNTSQFQTAMKGSVAAVHGFDRAAAHQIRVLEAQRLGHYGASQAVVQYSQQLQQASQAQGFYNKGISRSTLMLNQLMFAIEDASTQYGTQGLSGAVRGATNNLTAMAAMAGNTTALVGVLAVSIGLQAMDAFKKFREGTLNTTKQLENFRKELKRTLDASDRMVQFGRDLGRMDTADDVVREMQDRRDAIAANSAAMEELNTRLDSMRRGMAQVRDEMTWLDVFDSWTENLWKPEDKGLTLHLQELKTLEDELRKRAQDRVNDQRELNRLVERQIELRRQEAREESQHQRRLQALQDQLQAVKNIGEALKLQSTLFAELSPHAARVLEIEDERYARLQQIAGMKDQAIMAGLAKNIDASADAKLQALADSFGPLPKFTNTGPEGLAKGSQQALERFRQRQLGESAAIKSAEEKAQAMRQQQLAAAKKQADELREIRARLQQAQPFTVGILDN